MTEPHDDPELRELLPELATGALAGDERARALAHVATCAPCRHELAELSRAADAVLLLAPAREPPPAFEAGVLARLGIDTASGTGGGAIRWRLPRVRARRVLALAAAVVIAAGAGAQAVRWQSADDRQLAQQYRRTLEVADGRYLKAIRIAAADGQSAGTAFLYQGNPSWMLVTVFAGPVDGAYDVTAVDRNGAAHPAGTCEVTARNGTAGYRLTIAVSAVAQVQLRSRAAPGIVLTGVAH